MLSPLDDFPTWIEIFESSLDDESIVAMFIPDLQKLLTAYEFPQEIIQFLDEFETRFHKIIEKVVQNKMSETWLQLVDSLFEYGMLISRPQRFSTLVHLLQSSSKSDQLFIQTTFISKYGNQLNELLNTAPAEISIEVASLLVTLIAFIEGEQLNERLSQILNFWTSYENIRAIPNSDVTALFSAKKSTAFLPLLMKFLDSGIFDKKLCALKLLIEIIEQFVPIDFLSEEKNLAIILSVEFHIEFAPLLAKIYGVLASENLLTIEFLTQLWAHQQFVHASEKNQFFTIFESISKSNQSEQFTDLLLSPPEKSKEWLKCLRSSAIEGRLYDETKSILFHLAFTEDDPLREEAREQLPYLKQNDFSIFNYKDDHTPFYQKLLFKALEDNKLEDETKQHEIFEQYIADDKCEPLIRFGIIRCLGLVFTPEENERILCAANEAHALRYISFIQSDVYITFLKEKATIDQELKDAVLEYIKNTQDDSLLWDFAAKTSPLQLEFCRSLVKKYEKKKTDFIEKWQDRLQNSDDTSPLLKIILAFLQEVDGDASMKIITLAGHGLTEPLKLSVKNNDYIYDVMVLYSQKSGIPLGSFIFRTPSGIYCHPHSVVSDFIGRGLFSFTFSRASKLDFEVTDTEISVVKPPPKPSTIISQLPAMSKVLEMLKNDDENAIGLLSYLPTTKRMLDQVKQLQKVKHPNLTELFNLQHQSYFEYAFDAMKSLNFFIGLDYFIDCLPEIRHSRLLLNLIKSIDLKKKDWSPPMVQNLFGNLVRIALAHSGDNNLDIFNQAMNIISSIGFDYSVTVPLPAELTVIDIPQQEPPPKTHDDGKDDDSLESAFERLFSRHHRQNKDSAGTIIEPVQSILKTDDFSVILYNLIKLLICSSKDEITGKAARLNSIQLPMEWVHLFLPTLETASQMTSFLAIFHNRISKEYSEIIEKEIMEHYKIEDFKYELAVGLIDNSIHFLKNQQVLLDYYASIYLTEDTPSFNRRPFSFFSRGTEDFVMAQMERLEKMRQPFKGDSLKGEEIEKASHSGKPHCGLKNLCCTCFLNSTIQQFYCIRSLRKLVYDYQGNDPFLVQLRQLFGQMQGSGLDFVTTKPLINEWVDWGGEKLNPREQQDASEFTQQLIDKLEALPGVKDIFLGKLHQSIDGLEVDFHTERFEVFSTLPVELADTLEEGLEKIHCPDFFVNRNQYVISETKQKIDAKRIETIGQLPEHLIIQLKRFEYDYNRGGRTKKNQKVNYPAEIDFAKHCYDPSTPSRYILSGVVVHSGTAIGGHYISYIRDRDVDGEWYCYNDTKVTKSSLDQALEDGYLLVYDKAGCEIEEEPTIPVDLVQINEASDPGQIRLFCTYAFSKMMLSIQTEFKQCPYPVRYAFDVIPHMSTHSDFEEILKVCEAPLCAIRGCEIINALTIAATASAAATYLTKKFKVEFDQEVFELIWNSITDQSSYEVIQVAWKALKYNQVAVDLVKGQDFAFDAKHPAAKFQLLILRILGKPPILGKEDVFELLKNANCRIFVISQFVKEEEIFSYFQSTVPPNTHHRIFSLLLYLFKEKAISMFSQILPPSAGEKHIYAYFNNFPIHRQLLVEHMAEWWIPLLIHSSYEIRMKSLRFLRPVFQVDFFDFLNYTLPHLDPGIEAVYNEKAKPGIDEEKIKRLEKLGEICMEAVDQSISLVVNDLVAADRNTLREVTFFRSAQVLDIIGIIGKYLKCDTSPLVKFGDALYENNLILSGDKHVMYLSHAAIQTKCPLHYEELWKKGIPTSRNTLGKFFVRDSLALVKVDHATMVPWIRWGLIYYNATREVVFALPHPVLKEVADVILASEKPDVNEIRLVALSLEAIGEKRNILSRIGDSECHEFLCVHEGPVDPDKLLTWMNSPNTTDDDAEILVDLLIESGSDLQYTSMEHPRAATRLELLHKKDKKLLAKWAFESWSALELSQNEIEINFCPKGSTEGHTELAAKVIRKGFGQPIIENAVAKLVEIGAVLDDGVDHAYQDEELAELVINLQALALAEWKYDSSLLLEKLERDDLIISKGKREEIHALLEQCRI